jgi:hypothetical protein
MAQDPRNTRPTLKKTALPSRTAHQYLNQPLHTAPYPSHGTGSAIRGKSKNPKTTSAESADRHPRFG